MLSMIERAKKYSRIANLVDFNPNRDKLDLVYILKPQENNIDLRYSLRSVSKYCDFGNIWLVGYKPSWTTNVNYIQTYQSQGKYKNSITNYLAACNCPYITDNFILMNDDFFAIKPIDNWERDLNLCLGTLEDEIEKYSVKEHRSKWQNAFTYAVELLDQLDCNSHIDWETHLPIIINKKNFIAMMNMPEVKEFCNTPKVLHKRSLYGNLYVSNTNPIKIKDVKLDLDKDLTDDWLIGKWLSVYDDVIGNIDKFPKMNEYMESCFPNKCKYEK